MKKEKKINFKLHLNLPKIKFPMKANLKENEKIIINKWNKINLYNSINKKNKKKFIIHDGPPFANGLIHIGHAYNKILKDIILKYKIFMNFNISYIPGWDCHGLPIELEIQKKNNFLKIKTKSEIISFKKKCFNYVNKQILLQKKDFIRLGIIADWNNIYKTMDYKIIANTLRTLNKLIKLNYLVRKDKPVYWCIKCKSSLSEYEIEYTTKKSKSSYISFFIKNNNKLFNILNIKDKKITNYKIELIIWTTTIWSIPGNCGIAVNKYIEYSIFYFNKRLILISNNSKNIFFNNKNIKYKIIKKFHGKKLLNIKVYHPFSKLEVPIIFDNKIDKYLGTGITHIASQHGYDDYILSKKYKIKGLNVINDNGKYIDYIYLKKIKNLNISESEKYIIKSLKNNNQLFLIEEIKHNYPHCGRHKYPIIFRSTLQWFINLKKNNIKKKILKSIKSVKWIPSWGYKKIKKMIKERPDWCISRQRYWGTPIPIFVNKKTNKLHPDTTNIIEKISNKIEKYGPQYWDNIEKKKLIKDNYNDYEKTSDILDVWFDSGSTCFSVLNTNFSDTKKINMYIEGSDQYRGWFMSSLIIHTIINNKAPYKTIISHGFTVDKYGNKMSKSLNNYINPQIIINKYGADILRLWVSISNYSDNISISEEILERTTDIYRKIRNTIRFFISNLEKFNPKKNLININKILLIDKYIIYKTKEKQKEIIKLFKNFKIYKIIKKIENFCINDLSSFYIDIIKDRKYTIKSNTTQLYSLQTTMFIIVNAIIKWIAPILSFTSEEIWNYIPGKKLNSIFLEKKFYKFKKIKNNLNLKIWDKLIIIKKEINKIIENKIQKKIINNSLESKITLYTNINFYNKIKFIKKELKFIFIVSKLNIKFYKNKNFLIKFKKINGIKCKRCWHFTQIKNIFYQICKRCLLNISGEGENRILA